MVKMMMTTREENPVLYSKLRREYIVMSRIRFPVRTGSMLVRGKVVRLEQNLCSEVGIYGVILSGAEGEDEDHDNGKVLLNAFAGYTVRSKPADVDDGGVMMGVAALDSLAVVQ
uniref:Uncharacterized protein TCIL3000_7_3200 n=1 Tax=Trypanosoma congolense (strain IL3000) TaxID=1068625 RepID=G0UQ45_TRYCI|nr:unnamed protein product [Trypanosoma congolense IL3000]